MHFYARYKKLAQLFQAVSKIREGRISLLSVFCSSNHMGFSQPNLCVFLSFWRAFVYLLELKRETNSFLEVVKKFEASLMSKVKIFAKNFFSETLYTVFFIYF